MKRRPYLHPLAHLRLPTIRPVCRNLSRPNLPTATNRPPRVSAAALRPCCFVRTKSHVSSALCWSSHRWFPERTAGHVSRRMLERYSHVRMEAKRKAVECLSNSSKMGGYDTNRDTKSVILTARSI